MCEKEDAKAGERRGNMKIRSDFVSNSSSSSFIIAGDKDSLVARAHLTKKDIVDALVDLWGGKKKYDEFVKEHKSDWWDGKPFVVYDKKLKADKKEIDKLASAKDGYLTEWKSPFIKIDNESGECVASDGNHLVKFDEAYSTIRDVYGLPYCWNPNAMDGKVCSKYSKKAKRWIYSKVPDHVKKVVNDLVRHYGVMTNGDVMLTGFSRFLIHFGENEVWHLAHTNDPGKHDSKLDIDGSDYAKSWNEGVDNSAWESDNQTVDRFAEVLVRWLRDHGKLENIDGSATWNDLAGDIVAATLHEG